MQNKGVTFLSRSDMPFESVVWSGTVCQKKKKRKRKTPTHFIMNEYINILNLS